MTDYTIITKRIQIYVNEKEQNDLQHSVKAQHKTT